TTRVPPRALLGAKVWSARMVPVRRRQPHLLRDGVRAVRNESRAGRAIRASASAASVKPRFVPGAPGPFVGATRWRAAGGGNRRAQPSPVLTGLVKTVVTGHGHKFISQNW